MSQTIKNIGTTLKSTMERVGETVRTEIHHVEDTVRGKLHIRPYYVESCFSWTQIYLSL